MTKPNYAEHCERIANKVIALMNEHGADWVKPWATLGAPRNAHTGNHYTGINSLVLAVAAETEDYGSPYWATYKQWQAVTGDDGKPANVRKGEKARDYVLFWSPWFVCQTCGAKGKAQPKCKDKGHDVKKRLIDRLTAVFNAAQVDNCPARFLNIADTAKTVDRIPEIDSWFAGIGAKVRHGGDVASYVPTIDAITMPHIDVFDDAGAYYSTLAHEHVHWSGAESRLNRSLSMDREAYAFEELVAEMGAAMVSALVGWSPEPRADHAKYLNNWKARLADDPKAIYQAAKLAGKACEFLDGLATAVADAA